MTVFLLIYGGITAFPLFFTIVTAFKPINELFLYPPRFFVRNPTFENITSLFQIMSASRVPFERYLFNSLFVAIVGVAAYIIIAAMAAYPMAKHKFKGRIILYNIIVWAMLFSTQVTEVPQFFIISRLGLIDSYWALMVPTLAISMGVFLMRQFIVSTIPDALLESAKIDGASEVRIFWKIVMPMVKPAWLTLTVFTFQAFWNAPAAQFVYTEQMKVLQTALSQVAAVGLGRAGAGAAIALILLIPPITIFLFAQSSIVETMSTSGLK
jgi:ABC-type glycerol-3-phosphate transport system permease component